MDGMKSILNNKFAVHRLDIFGQIKKEMNKLQKKERIQKECCISCDCFVDYMSAEVKKQFGADRAGHCELGMDEFYLK